MTEFEIDATFNTICRPGRVVKILTKGGKEENVPIKVWKHWTIVEVYEHHVLMKSEQEAAKTANTEAWTKHRSHAHTAPRMRRITMSR